MIFISVPYSSKDQSVIDARVAYVIDYVAKLMLNGVAVCSPVLIYHQVIKKHPHLFKDVEYFFWEQVSCAQLKQCESVHLLMLPGWDQSTGVKLELSWADKLCIPVKRIEVPNEWNWS